ncbi:MAG: BT0820 family HAD-type phosphatase [Moheibacter sp.]
MKSYLIAVDFDGTIVKDAYPKIGKPMLFAFESLKELQIQGHRLVLWTYRHGKALEEAVEFCHENGIEFYAVNSSFEGEIFEIEKQSRKIHADLFIDDRNLGGFPGWGEVLQVINKRIEFSLSEHGREKEKRKRKRGFFRR